MFTPKDFAKKELSDKFYYRENNEKIIIIPVVNKTEQTFEVTGNIPVFYKDKKEDHNREFEDIDDIYDFIFSFVDENKQNEKYIYIR